MPQRVILPKFFAANPYNLLCILRPAQLQTQIQIQNITIQNIYTFGQLRKNLIIESLYGESNGVGLDRNSIYIWDLQL